MIRFAAFTLLVTLMTATALLLAGGHSNRAEAGDARCRTIIIEPDAAYGVQRATKITECR